MYFRASCICRCPSLFVTCPKDSRPSGYERIKYWLDFASQQLTYVLIDLFHLDLAHIADAELRTVATRYLVSEVGHTVNAHGSRSEFSAKRERIVVAGTRHLG